MLKHIINFFRSRKYSMAFFHRSFFCEYYSFISLSRPKIVNPIQDNKIIKRIAGLNQKL